MFIVIQKPNSNKVFLSYLKSVLVNDTDDRESRDIRVKLF